MAWLPLGRICLHPSDEIPRPGVRPVYPLAQAVEAFSAKAGGGIPGRIVLQP